jgi:hypothetical protein
MPVTNSGLGWSLEFLPRTEIERRNIFMGGSDAASSALESFEKATRSQ